MIGQKLRVEEVRNERDLMVFIRFPWQIYKGDRFWVPPLIKNQLLKFSPNHPFRSHSEMIFLLAKRGEQIIGRIAGIIDHHYIDFIRRRLDSSGSSSQFRILRLRGCSYQRLSR